MDRYIVRVVSVSDSARIAREFGLSVEEKEFGDIRFVMMKEPDEWRSSVLRDISCMDVYRGNISAKDYKSAMSNTMNIMPPRLLATDDIGKHDLFSDGEFMAGEDEVTVYGFYCEGFRLTNTAWFGGAVAAFYPGVLKRIGELLGEDFYVTFPSANEARIHPAHITSATEIAGALRCWNNAGTFSDKVFRYSLVRNELQEIELYEW